MNSGPALDAGMLRQQAAELIERGDAAVAAAALRRLWKTQPNLAVASYVLSSFEKIKAGLFPVSVRLAVLRSFTVEPVVTLCRAGAAVSGIDLDVRVGEFNAYAQEILDPESRLYGSEPDVCLLAVQTRDIAPELWGGFADLAPKEIDDVVRRVVRDYSSWIGILRSRTKAHIVIHSLEKPSDPAHGLYDSQIAVGQGSAVELINRGLADLARGHSGVYVLDYDALVARHGRSHWYDGQKWLTMRMPIAAGCLIHLADEWLRILHPLAGKVSKALVCDLDNTLWGGIIGEDGIGGLELGTEYPGAAYREFQRAILDLHRRGILLAVCSKNNRDDAMEVFDRHPQMLLRPEHFASIKINWADKARNIEEIARELNIGIDALAFVDDNPIEREMVRSRLPEVAVIDLPDDPFQFASTLRRFPGFERLKLSEEDRERGRMYAEQRQREELQQGAASLEEFYHSLGMKMEFSPVSAATMSRVAQLTQKTNQFNLTTRRYSEQQIAGFAATPNRGVAAVRVIDRFGDNGIVGVVITCEDADAWEIDTFLMSCRVIGRTIETGMLATVAERARASGARRLIGRFLPTKKNAPCSDFYARHGFSCTGRTPEGSCWELDISRGGPTSPPWIERTVIEE